MLFVLLFSAFAQAVDLDARLAGYVTEFNLKPLRDLPPARLELRRLGQMLFMDRMLSGNKNIACLDCHDPRLLTHDGLPLSLGEGAVFPPGQAGRRLQGEGIVLARNSPALFNVGLLDDLLWDGRVALHNGVLTTPVPLPPEVRATVTSALSAQALLPIVDRAEMRGQEGTNPIADAATEEEAWSRVLRRLLGLRHYQSAFAVAFPGVTSFNIGHVGEALAAFQSGQFHFNDTPFDRWLEGDRSALTVEQKIGMDVFFKAQCGTCHQGENLTNMNFVNVGVPQIGPGKKDGDDLGRQLIAPEEMAPWGFRVPPLRNVAVTAPYMHNGVFATLDEVVNHFNDVRASLTGFRWELALPNYNGPLAGHDHSRDEQRLATMPPDLPLRLNLSEREKKSLVEFLRTALTDVRLQTQQ
jgi:cytochrome c peroxidase